MTIPPGSFDSRRGHRVAKPAGATLDPPRGQIAFTDTSKTTLRGPAAELLQVHGNRATRVFYVESGALVDISGLTVTGGQVASPGGAGILNAGTLTVDRCQIYVFGSFTTKDSIIRGATYGTINDQGHNLIGVNPLLGSLQDNGGPTWTHAPAWNSPAIDAGNNTGAPATDQRGAPRPQNGLVDSGAFEAMLDSGEPMLASIGHKSVSESRDPDGSQADRHATNLRRVNSRKRSPRSRAK